MDSNLYKLKSSYPIGLCGDGSPVLYPFLTEGAKGTIRKIQNGNAIEYIFGYSALLLLREGRLAQPSPPIIVMEEEMSRYAGYIEPGANQRLTLQRPLLGVFQFPLEKDRHMVALSFQLRALPGSTPNDTFVRIILYDNFEKTEGEELITAKCADWLNAVQAPKRSGSESPTWTPNDLAFFEVAPDDTTVRDSGLNAVLCYANDRFVGLVEKNICVPISILSVAHECFPNTFPAPRNFSDLPKSRRKPEISAAFLNMYRTFSSSNRHKFEAMENDDQCVPLLSNKEFWAFLWPRHRSNSTALKANLRRQFNEQDPVSCRQCNNIISNWDVVYECSTSPNECLCSPRPLHTCEPCYASQGPISLYVCHSCNRQVNRTSANSSD